MGDEGLEPPTENMAANTSDGKGLPESSVPGKGDGAARGAATRAPEGLIGAIRALPEAERIDRLAEALAGLSAEQRAALVERITNT